MVDIISANHVMEIIWEKNCKMIHESIMEVKKDIIDMINVKTAITANIIRSEVGGQKAEDILSIIDYVCNQEDIRNKAHNYLELHRIGKERRV